MRLTRREVVYCWVVWVVVEENLIQMGDCFFLLKGILVQYTLSNAECGNYMSCVVNYNKYRDRNPLSIEIRTHYTKSRRFE